MVIAKHSFEVKTASLGVNGTFQFNHVRSDRDYDYLRRLVIGHPEWGIGQSPLQSLSRQAVRTWTSQAVSNGSRTRAQKALRLLTAALADL